MKPLSRKRLRVDYPKPEFLYEIPGKRINNSRVGMFKCKVNDCGKEFECVISRINQNHRPVKSCGCAQKLAVAETGFKNTKHGQSHTSEYNIYMTMRARCYNPNNYEYDLYGGRGIKVSDDWLDSFENFYRDMGA